MPNPTTVDRPEFLTVREWAARYPIGVTLARRLLREGSVPHLRLGRKILISTTAIEAWEKDQARSGNTRGSRYGEAGR